MGKSKKQIANYFLIVTNGFIREHCNYQWNDNGADGEKDDPTNIVGRTRARGILKTPESLSTMKVVSIPFRKWKC